MRERHPLLGGWTVLSILEKTGQTASVTDETRALELFVDRHEAMRRVIEHFNTRPTPERILFFSGDGGNGKSLLLKYLFSKCCIQFDAENWEWIKHLPFGEFVSHVLKAEGVTSLPKLHIDLGSPARGEERPRECFSALLMMRRSLGSQGFQFPIFDYACMSYMHRTGSLSEERIKSLFPSDSISLAADLLELLTNTNWVSEIAAGVMKIIQKQLGKSYALYKGRRRLAEDDVSNIERMDPHRELNLELPSLFAADLNAAMAMNTSVHQLAIFFDTHEQFWGSERSLSEDLFFERDEWLRRLLVSLDLGAGISVIVAGREPPRWSEAVRFRLPPENISLFEVGHLSREDADQYLELFGVLDPKLRRSVVSYAQIRQGQIHPFYLSLCGAVVAEAQRAGSPINSVDFEMGSAISDQGGLLVQRLLRYVNADAAYAVKALSAARAFDRSIYFKIGEELELAVSEPAFRLLTSFSFVWRVDYDGGGWYRIHDLLRRVLRDQRDGLTTRTHEFLEKYFRELASEGDVSAAAEAIYHANQLDWQRGVREWVDRFENALLVTNYDLCRALIEIRQELLIKKPLERARISRVVGEFFASLGKYEEARAEFREAASAIDEADSQGAKDRTLEWLRGQVLRGLGECEGNLSLFEDSIRSFQSAVSALDSAAAQMPEEARVLKEKGKALRGLGRVQREVSQLDEAANTIELATTVLAQAAEITTDETSSAADRAGIWLQRGKSLAKLGRHVEAHESLAMALKEYQEALIASPSDVSALLKKADTHRRLGQLLASRGDNEAEAHYRSAISAYDDALRLAPSSLAIHQNRGLALKGLGNLLISSSRKDAKETLMAAGRAFEEALKLAPNQFLSLVEKGNSLSSLAEIEATSGAVQEAKHLYRQALEAYDEATKWAPQRAVIQKSKGLAHLGLASLIWKDSNAAIEHLELAQQCFARLLEVDPMGREAQRLKCQAESMIAAKRVNAKL